MNKLTSQLQVSKSYLIILEQIYHWFGLSLAAFPFEFELITRYPFSWFTCIYVYKIVKEVKWNLPSFFCSSYSPFWVNICRNRDWISIFSVDAT